MFTSRGRVPLRAAAAAALGSPRGLGALGAWDPLGTEHGWGSRLATARCHL